VVMFQNPSLSLISFGPYLALFLAFEVQFTNSGQHTHTKKKKRVL